VHCNPCMNSRPGLEAVLDNDNLSPTKQLCLLDCYKRTDRFSNISLFAACFTVLIFNIHIVPDERLGSRNYDILEDSTPRLHTKRRAT
jgi:hypothetical protein